MREGDKAGFLQSAARSNVRGAATGTGNSAQLIGDEFQFLDQVGAEAPAAKRFVHLQLDFALRAIVVDEDAALAGCLPVQFQHPLRVCG